MSQLTDDKAGGFHLPNGGQFKLIRVATAKQWAPLQAPFAWYP
jgi:hypothetical protein